MQNVAKFRLIEGIQYLSPVRTNSGKYVHFLYLGPIRTNESQRAFDEQKLPQMTFLGLFRCKQTFSQNVAKFRLIEGLLVPPPSTYE